MLAIVFQLVTTPAAGHLLGRAAHAARAPMSKYTVIDELRPLPAVHGGRADPMKLITAIIKPFKLDDVQGGAARSRRPAA